MSLYSSLTQVLAPFAAKINGLLTGWDGTRYNTPGEAVRQQIADLHVLIGDEPGTAIASSAVSYDGTSSDLSATNVQAAVDETNEKVAAVNERLDEYEDIFTGDVGESVENWLDAHPEATTTVEDGSLTYAKLVKGTLGYITPHMFGAKGDGQADDSAAFNLMFAHSCGIVLIPDGTYLINGVSLTHDTTILMSEKSVLKQAVAEAESEVMLSFGTNSLVMDGGTIDCNTLNANIRPYVLAGSVLHDHKLMLKGVTFKHISKYGVYIATIGGHIVFDSCEFYDTAWGTEEHRPGTLASAQGGEAGYPADVHILNCKAISYCYNDSDMTSAPGGFFFSCRDNSEDLAHGNRSTVEAKGNYFEGYGMYYGINVIYPIHFYPLWSGVRITDNMFVKCMHGAIDIKSCEDTIITNNVILDAIVHDNVQPTLNYGMISYTPNHHGATGYSRKRAVISGNIINGCGGTESTRGVGIAVMGDSANAPDSYADSVIISNNVINNGLRGIYVIFAQNIEVGGNVMSNVSNGITYQSVINLLNIHDNVITTSEIEGNTYGVSANDECPDLTVDAKNNLIKVLSTAGYGFNIRGGGTVTLVGNHVITAQNAMPYLVSKYGSSGANIKKLFWDGNAFESANHPNLGLANIDLISGKFDHYNFSSDYSAELGTIFVDYATSKMYIAVSRTNHKAWREITLTQVS